MYKYILCLFFVFFFGLLQAQEPLVKDENLPSNTQGEDIALEENQRLNKELEDLKQRLLQEEIEKKKAQDSLASQKNKNQLAKVKAGQISALKSKMAREPLIYKDAEDVDYNIAYQAIFLGDLEKAESHLNAFLQKNNTDVLSLGSSTNNAADIKRLQHKAMYLMAEIKLINDTPRDALVMFANAYRDSDDSRLILISLLGMVETFEVLDRGQELCLTVAKVSNVVSQIRAVDTSFRLEEDQRVFLQFVSKKFNCGAAPSSQARSRIPGANPPANSQPQTNTPQATEPEGDVVSID
jgi:hypothetical protein